MGQMKTIELSRGKTTIVDTEDYEELSQYKWVWLATSGVGYAVRYYKNDEGSWKQESMHRRLLNAPKGKLVDHANGDSLDNRKENLRLCTHKGNNRNRRLTTRNTSGLKGAYWHKNKKRWYTAVYINGKLKNSKGFLTAQEAHDEYKRLTKKHYGEFRNYGTA